MYVCGIDLRIEEQERWQRGPYGKQKETPERAPKWVRNRAAEHLFCANSFSINHIIHSNDKHLRKLLFHSVEMRNPQFREGSNLPKATQIYSSRAGTGTYDFLIPRPQLFTLYCSAWGKPCNLRFHFLFCTIEIVLSLRISELLWEWKEMDKQKCLVHCEAVFELRG